MRDFDVSSWGIFEQMAPLFGGPVERAIEALQRELEAWKITQGRLRDLKTVLGLQCPDHEVVNRGAEWVREMNAELYAALDCLPSGPPSEGDYREHQEALTGTADALHALKRKLR